MSKTPDMSGAVMVGLATIPERERSLQKTVASLVKQADKVVVALNGHKHVPAFLAKYRNVEPVLLDGSGGDGEKFYGVDDWDGFVATCDDDLLYPPDYIEKLQAGIERHGLRTAVSFHGGTTLGWTHRSCAATHKRIRCLDNLGKDDTDVNVLGTGTMMYHSDHVPIWRDVFRFPNMADVQMACHGRLLGIPFVCLQHKGRWLKDICPPEGPRIYEANRDNLETFQNTRVERYNELTRVDWEKKAPSRPHVRVSISTCNREEKLMELLHDLHRESAWAKLDVTVYEDPTDVDYLDAKLFCIDRGWKWYRFPERLGKPGYWKLVDRELREARSSKAEWFLFMPDDIRLVKYAIPKAIKVWDRLDNPSTLTLWRLQAFEGLPSWTGIKPVQREFATEIYHVDGLYLCKRDTLKTLDFRCGDTSRQLAPSSGVGSKISKRLHHAKKRMYRVDESLAVSNDDGVSMMNPEDRVLFPAVTL